MPDLHVIVISSVRPEATSGGQIILHRHLVDQPGITLEVYGSEPKRPTLSKLVRRIAGRLGKTRLHRFVEDFWVLWGGRWADPELPTSVERPERTVVLTVAHGDGFMAARRFARRHKLPLGTIFHDWWPDMVETHAPFRSLLERQFRALACESDVSFCVCEGMREALGPVPNTAILPPIPADPPKVQSPRLHPPQPFTIVCFGNLREYGPMLGDALEESLKYPEILLQVRGSNPAWSEERKAKMRANGRWLDFAPRADLDAWLASADAFLVPMVFDPTMRHRMETSFPSKLVEFIQLGKPIIVWGPEYCSAVKWARDGNKAICVKEAGPVLLIETLFSLRQDTRKQGEFTLKASETARAEFDPDRIQGNFLSILSDLNRGSTLQV